MMSGWVKITITDAMGSTPRDVGACMFVSADNQQGSIGGGALEFRAVEAARKLLFSDEKHAQSLEFPLGPTLNQCCGGYVKLDLARVVSPAYTAYFSPKITVFGAGHVGTALMQALKPLPFTAELLDNRQSFAGNTYNLTENLKFDENSIIYIMTHSHAEDLHILDAILTQKVFGFVGLIGSKTKWVRFQKQLKSKGHAEEEIARVKSPIGISGIDGKEPEIIAASIVVEALRVRSTMIARLSDAGPQKVKAG